MYHDLSKSGLVEKPQPVGLGAKSSGVQADYDESGFCKKCCSSFSVKKLFGVKLI